MATDYGTDISGATDLTPTLLNSSGIELLKEVAVRRQYTPLGSLLSAPAEITCDLRQFISTTQGLSSRDLGVIRSTATSAIKADPRFFSVVIDLDWQPATYTLTMRETIQSSEGPFQLTLAITAVTLQVLA